MTDLTRIFHESGLAEAIQPPDMLRAIEATRLAIDETGAIQRPAVAPHLPPQGMDFAAGSTSRQRVKRAGVLSLLAAWCGTAPSSGGGATVTVTQATAADPSGTDVIATLTIPVGQKIAETSPMVNVAAGAWLAATVTTAAGSSGVSISLTISGANP